MHPALLIDEILERILEHCADWSVTDYRWTLCQLARSCRAWKDPALDRLWRRLDSVEPLTRLGGWNCCSTEGSTNTPALAFAGYASRVKHIVFKLDQKLPLILGVNPPFPFLKSGAIQGDGCLVPSHCLLSPMLQELDVDLRGTHSSERVSRRGHALADTFESIPSLKTTLEKLRIKGFLTPELDRIIPSFRFLRSLTLLRCESLSVETFASLGGLEHLEDLYVHAGHIDTEDFITTTSSPPSQLFPDLKSLRVRAHRSLICAIVDVLPRSTLRSLYLETEEPAQGPSAWNSTFALIASKAADTLLDLTLDQILDPEEFESHPSTSTNDTRFVLETLQPLNKLRVLRRLTIDAMILPDFTDKDIETMASWWPRLEHLDLGGFPDAHEHFEAPKITIQALRALAKHCPNLRSLSIPLNPSSRPEDKPADAVRQTALERLLVGSPPANEDIAAFVRSVIDIFPCLREIECTSAETSLSVDVQDDYRDHVLQVEYPKATSDGFADGQ